HPETIPLWLEGRLNPVVAKTTSQHSGRLGRFLDSAARRAELIKPDTPDWAAEVAVRSFDRVFEFVFSTQRSDSERLEITEAFLDMIGTYGEINYVTKRGAEGIPSSEFIAALSDGVALEPADFWAGTPKKPA
ncbi:MAG: hypothetical protein JHC87_03915, partial [Thermoleophilaceae bacterium]|nr:hypothetical protein [Thermoleophilaceae bacterium]